MRELKLKRVYRHFKGDYYLTEDIANDSETGEPFVVYRKLYGDGGSGSVRSRCFSARWITRNTPTVSRSTALNCRRSKARRDTENRYQYVKSG